MSHLDLATQHYQHLKEQGVGQAKAALHTKQRFGLTDRQLGQIMLDRITFDIDISTQAELEMIFDDFITATKGEA
jgi:hypothetical protein